MATNTLPSGIGDLFLLADRMADGVALHGPWILQNWVQPDEFAAVLREAREAEAEHCAARGAKAAAGKRFADLDAELTSWLARARLVVMLACGGQWSERWIATGFTHRGTNVPKRIGPRIELVGRLARFFAERSEFEVPFAGVTASAAAQLQKELAEASAAIRATAAEAMTRKQRRDVTEKKLRGQMRTVVLFLSYKLGKSDSRWLAFGLNRPDAKAPVEVRRDRRGGAEPMQVDFSLATEPVAETKVA
jgi:hypothetical protein